MGNVVSFNSPRLEGASTLAVDNQYAFETSYAFDPKGSNAFGVPATITFGGSPGPITPVITVPAAATDGVPATYQCNPFPEGVSTSSVLCPGLKNTEFHPGTVSIAFTSGDPVTQGYYSGVYAFSVTTVSGGEGSTVTVYDSTSTVSSTSFTTLSEATTTTVRGTCATATATSASSGTGFSSRSIASTGGMRLSSNSTMSRPTGSSLRPSGSISSVHVPSGSGKSSSKTSPAPSNSGSGPSRSGKSSSQTSPAPSNSGSGPSGSGKLSSNPSGPTPSLTGAQTITKPGVTATSTSTHITTITITTVITTYVPCSSAVATQGASTIYSSYLTKSIATKTITSVITETTVICPATKGGSQALITQPESPNSPIETIVITTTRYTCPTTPPPPCPTDGSVKKRDAGFDGPDFTLTGGDAGPTNGGGSTVTTHLPVTTSTVTVTRTRYQFTSTSTQGCLSSVSTYN